MPGRPRALLAALACTLTALVAATAASADGGEPGVTVISDSVLTSILWHQENLDVLSQGFDLDMEVAIGRRLAGVSFPIDGVPAPTVLDLVPTLAIRPTVIVEMGYNDDASAFRGEAEQVIDLLLARGAQRIIWPTLSESISTFASMNQDLIQLLLAHPQLTLADWNSYSGPHPDWFQTDHLHLQPSGGGGMATLLHGALVSTLANGTTVALPPAREGSRFSTQLAPPGETGPASWRIVAGSLPRGLQLLADGLVSGTPRTAGSFQADALVEDGADVIAHVRLTLDVAGTARRLAGAHRVAPASYGPLASGVRMMAAVVRTFS